MIEAGRLATRTGRVSPPRIPIPPGRRKRLVGLDATRGVALLGMVAVHSLYEVDSAGRPTVTYLVFAGRAAAVFAVLAGVGIAFLTGRRRIRISEGLPAAVPLGVRALLIGAIGLSLGYTDAELGEVILPYYAVMFLLTIPLVFLPTWAIALLGTAIALGMPAASHLLRPHLPEPSMTNPTFVHLVDHPGQLLVELSVTGFYPALSWLAYLCAGLVIGRLNLGRIRTAVALLGAGIVLAVAASATSWILLNRYGGRTQILAAQRDSGQSLEEAIDLLAFGADGITPTSTWWWLAVDAPHTGTPVNIVSTTGVALALIGVFLLVRHVIRPVVLHGISTAVLLPLAAVGSMTLTFYTAHVIFINSKYDTFDALPGYLIQVAAALLIGLAWRATIGRGPLEGILAAVTSQTRQWAVARMPRRRRPTAAPVTRQIVLGVGIPMLDNQSEQPRNGVPR